MQNIGLTDKVKKELEELKEELSIQTYNDLVKLLIREFKIRREYENKEKSKKTTPSKTS